MGIIEGLGFKIFRLKDEKQDAEFLLYDIRTNLYNQYSKLRLKEILIKEIGLNRVIRVYRDISKLDENKAVKIKDLQDWFDNDIEEEYILIDNVNYMPINKEIICDDIGKKYFNIYKKSNLVAKDGSFENVKTIIYNLCDNSLDEFNYICKWLAWIVQNPCQRIPTALIFQGVQGSGKTAFTDLILKPIFEWNMRYINQTDIDSEFNDFMFGVQLIIANEVIHNENKIAVSDKLKNYVADTNIPLKRKFKNTLNIRNYCNFIFQTNNMLPLKMDADDRRYSVFKSSYKIDIQFVKVLEKEYNDKSLNEVGAFYNYLLKLEVKRDEVIKPLFTKAKKDILEASYNSVQEFMKEVLEDLQGDLTSYEFINANSWCSFIPLKEFYLHYVNFSIQNGYKHYFSRSKFTREIKKHFNLDVEVQNLNGNSVRALIIRRKTILI